MNLERLDLAPGGTFASHARAMEWAQRWSKAWKVRYRVRRVPGLRVWHVCPTTNPAPSNR